jgi:hypothetical protein
MRRPTRGFMPVCRVKTRLKWLGSGMPQPKASSALLEQAASMIVTGPGPVGKSTGSASVNLCA